MGLGKFWIKHGPGSPGQTAKAISKNFMRLKSEIPDASKEQLLLLTLMNRMNAYKKHGLNTFSEEEIIEIIQQCNGKLWLLVKIIVLKENPTAREVQFAAPDIYNKMMYVIQEQIDKYAPGADINS